MSMPVYLDYAATTPVDPEVAQRMAECLTFDGNFGNPASRSHFYGWRAEEAVEEARNQLAILLGADPREIVWTSGATESNNLAIKGIAESRADKGKHIITSVTEHKAVLDVCKYLEQKGFEITWLRPDSSGIVTPEQVAAALRPDTILVSLMHVNNEIGVVTDIGAVGELCRSKGVIFHVDAAQSAGKLPIDVHELKVDLLSVSAHKMYGPKGIGALFVRRTADFKLVPLIHGGGHERGMRSGTLPTHQIVGLGEAAHIAQKNMVEEQARIKQLRDRFWHKVQELDDVYVNGALEPRVAGNLNISFGGVDGEQLLMMLRELAVSTGSACTSASLEPSYVLKAIGLSDQLAHSALRFSFGRFTTDADVDFAAEKVVSVVREMRG
ncbi:IscS subfamily cysteine desulfurase [Saccharophagus sp. K07]|mgnify:CR=1 FL=1|jgi:cysteine desulfurase|uniref:IscS subfamily cysteine desulfurase n=1 Tax=Saccharophagus sp. K07 TaxID=2283636 RepID=UPI0016526D0F|nr:IscS subfamily cysteine desulfurase [Saccharophagus sp. K07]MBC6905716.1 IscS subfamily cysteine desulfurase [Saccharophagus sp. K07]